MSLQSDENLLNSLIELEEVMGYSFHDKSILLNSLVHRSYSNENKGFKNINNEKLELLGDAVLSLIVVEYLFNRFINLTEGEIVKIKSAVVSKNMLVDFAQKIDLGKFVLMSKGEHHAGGSCRPSLLSDAFEALMGALFLDGGLEAAKMLLIPLLIPQIDDINTNEKALDYKTLLQEYTQSKFRRTPRYVIQKEMGPDHKKKFEIGVFLNGKRISTGIGNSKKEAEQKASKVACENLNIKIGSLF